MQITPSNRILLTAWAALFTSHFAAGADFATQVMEATFKFENEGSDATCFLVRREAPDEGIYLVTAGHALRDTTNEKATLVLRKPKPDGSYERVDYALALRRDGQPLWVCHERQDVAVVRVTGELPAPVAALPASVIADEARLKASGVHVCSPLFVFGYPLGLEGDASGLPIARQGIFSTPPLLSAETHPTFKADYKTFKGDSGGPVFIPGADQSPLIVGVVSDEHYFDERWKGMYGEHRVRISLDVVKVTHARYVRETLDVAAKQNQPTLK